MDPYQHRAWTRLARLHANTVQGPRGALGVPEMPRAACLDERAGASAQHHKGVIGSRQSNYSAEGSTRVSNHSGRAPPAQLCTNMPRLCFNPLSAVCSIWRIKLNTDGGGICSGGSSSSRETRRRLLERAALPLHCGRAVFARCCGVLTPP